MLILLILGKLPFILFVLAIAMTLANADIPRPRGVALFKSSLYIPRSDLSWTCLDNTKTILYEQINDDYCDCADGSDEPGTAACATGRFNCENKGHRSKDIHSSRVNDGICDCCDGSDEWDVGTGDCQNTCQELERLKREKQLLEADLHKRGKVKRSEFIAKGEKSRADREARYTEYQKMRSEKEAVKAEKEELKRNAEAAETEALEFYKEQQREKESTETPPADENSQSSLTEAEAMFAKYDLNKDGFIDVSELMTDATLDRDRDGITSVEEAKYFLDEQERIDRDAFCMMSWQRIKPLKMLAEGVFEAPISEGKQNPETSKEAEITKEDEPEDGHEHEVIEEGEEEHYEEDEGDADVGVGSVSEPSHPSPEYDPETQRLIDLANEARRAFSEAEQELRTIDNEIKNIEDANAKDYGPSQEYAILDGECFTYEDREYVYTLCLFVRASQKQRSGGSETTLGVWDQWIDEGDIKYKKQKYSRGAACWNGPQRSVIVQLRCGLEQMITSVTEPNRCEYHYVFETPAACDYDDHNDLNQHDEL